MPPVVGFQSYLANAQRIMQQDAHAPGGGGPRPADCALGLKGRSIVVVSGDRPSLEADRARSDFVDSFVKQFGEACRSIVESALLGKNAKPLTARVVIELNAKAMALKPSDMTVSLSELINRAMQADAKGVTHEQFQELANVRPELKAELASLSALRQQAEEALVLLGAFTGAEIAAAFRPGRAPTAKEQEVRDTIRMLVARVVDKHMDLAGRLDALYRGHGDPTGDIFAMVTRCNNRIEEVQRLVVELSSLDAKSDDARLGMYAAELLPRLAFEIHDTARTLECLRASLQPLANRFDAMRAAAADDGHIGMQDVAMLLREIDLARKALKSAAKEGIKAPDGAVLRPDPGLLREMDALLDKLQADVNRFTIDALEAKAENWVHGVAPSFSATKLFTVYRDVVKSVADDPDEMEHFINEMEAFRMAAIEWARGMAAIATMAALNESYQHLNTCMKTFRLASDAVKAIKASRPGLDKDDERSGRIEELKDKIAELKARLLKLDEQTRRELADAADADSEELEKMQHLLDGGPGVLAGAMRIQRLYDLLVDRREENEVFAV